MSQFQNETDIRIFQLKPYLKKYFNLFLSSPPLYQLEKTQNQLEFFIQFQGKKLASSIAPSEQAKRSIAQHQFKRTDIVIVFGLGNPHTITELNHLLEPGQIIIFIDADAQIMHALWEYTRTTALVPGRHFFCGEEFQDHLAAYIDSIPVNRISGVKIIKNSASIQLAPSFYQHAETEIQNQISAKFSDLLTRFEFERIWIKNSAINTILFDEKKCFKINDFKNQWNGLPGMLVSAGPSLRKQCALIQKIRDKIFLLSCDTSLKVLLAHGIIPDGVVTLDAQTHSFFHFLGTDLTTIPLFADMVTYPPLLRHAGFVIHSLTAKFIADAAGEVHRETTSGGDFAETVLGPIGDIQSGGSVATNAFDILRFLGITEIFLAGQDLAYTGREIHSTGTHHNEKWLTVIHRKNSLEKINEAIIRKRKTKEVESCDEQTVLTDYILEIYKFWFEQSALSLPDFKIYNICGGGSKLENIPSLSSQQVESMFSQKNPHGYFWHTMQPWTTYTSQKTAALPYPTDSLLEALIELKRTIHLWDVNIDLAIELKNISLIHPLFKNMIRKTEVYLQRHQSLSQEKKLDLVQNSLFKEIRFLKKGILSNV